MKNHVLILGLVFAFMACFGTAEELRTRPAVVPDAASLTGSSSDYRLGSGDLIEISVYGVQSYKHTVRVAASGMIRLPLIGEVSVEGRTAAELEEHLEDRLREGVIQEPTVSVFTVEYNSRMVFVLGSVIQPGQFQIIRQLRVIDVLTMAGGLTPDAGDELLIQRQPSGGAVGATGQVEPEMVRINLKELLTGGDPSLNTTVEDGDVITVEKKMLVSYYVVGEVIRPGPFDLSKGTPILASQALARAGGAIKTAKMSKGMLLRFGEGQERQQLPLDFNAIYEGKAEDYSLRPDDIIFLPGSKVKTLGYAMLDIIPAMVARGLVWY